MFHDIDIVLRDWANLALYGISHDNNHDWQEYHRCDAVFFTVHQVRRHAVLIHSVIEILSVSSLVIVVLGFFTV